MLYPETTVQSQYAASPTIRALVDGINELIDPRADIELFYENIFDPSTARGVGLDYWARIVGVSRNIYIENLTQNFGFFGSELMPWDQGVFYEPGQVQVGSYQLDDTAFRKFIRWKALANISTTDAHTLNVLFSELLEAPVAVTETGVMQIRVTTTQPLSDWQKIILRQYGMFGKPAGVGFEFFTVETPVIGFVSDGENYLPFGQAPFYNGAKISDFIGD